MNDQDFQPESLDATAEETNPATGAESPTSSGRRRSLSHLLGVLAGERDNPREGERDIVASAIRRALQTITLAEFPSLSATLEDGQFELHRRANACQGSDLPLQGNLGALPFLALCAEIHRNGFVEADGKEARCKLFLSLVDLVAFCEPLAAATAFEKLAAGLRVLIERLVEAPKAGVSTRHVSVWELLDWVEDHVDMAAYVKGAMRSLRRQLLLAWRASVPHGDVPNHEDGEEGTAALVETSPNESLWVVPSSTQFEHELPAGLKQTLLATELTRITAVSRYASASLLNRSEANMQAEVARFLDEHARNPADRPHLLAQLLAIATGTPVEEAYRVRYLDPDDDGTPRFPGVLTLDAGWLIRSEFDPRTTRDNEFQARAVHQPIPETLAELLRAQPGGIHPGRPVIELMSCATRPSTPRAESAWFTTLASRLMHDGRFGISLAQHVLHTSLGLDTSPLFYDRIPADYIAHAVAKVTHRWFGCAPRPRAAGMPSHFVGSQRVVDRAACKEFFQSLRAGWSDKLTLPERIHLRSRNLRFGLLLAVAHRTNGSITELTRASLSAGHRVITVRDKAVALDHASRLAALSEKLIRELNDYLAELAKAIEEYPKTALAQVAEGILAGRQSLFLQIESVNSCYPVDIDRHLADSPPWAADIRNWSRQLANDLLSERVSEPLRVAQMGWHGTRAGAISELSVLSPLNACDRLSIAIDNTLKEIGWCPLPRSGLPSAIDSMPLVHWLQSSLEHRRAFDHGLKQLEQVAETGRQEVARNVLPGLNAFFRANNIPLEATRDGFALRGATTPFPVDRKLHEVMLRVMASGSTKPVPEQELLHDWVKKARREKVVAGPLPRQVIRTRPRQPGPFLQVAHRSLDHRDAVLAAAHEADLSPAAKTFLTVLLEGWVSEADVVLLLMRPDANLHDLVDEDVLLIEALPSDDRAATKTPLGCLAFNGAAALALRAWHRGGRASTPDLGGLRTEIFGAISHALAPAVTEATAFDELEIMMRAYLGLVAPGIVREVVTRRVIPSFAPIARVVALHEDHPIHPTQPPFLSTAAIAAGVRKARSRQSQQGYNHVKYVVNRLVGRWTPVNDETTRGEAVAQLRLLVPDGVPRTGVQVAALYASAYLTEGLQKEHVRPVTVQDAVYAIGHALAEALPQQADLSRRDVWQTAYARSLAQCPEQDRFRLAKDLSHFQKVMAREYDMPVVSLAPLLNALELPSPPEPVGFLTRHEQSAAVSFGRLRLEAAMHKGSPGDQQTALSELAITTCMFSTPLRDREIRVPQAKAWRQSRDERPILALRSNGQDVLKSEAGRRSLHFTGPFASLSILTIDRLVQVKQTSSAFRAADKLFLPETDTPGTAGSTDLTKQINADLRYITSCPLAAVDVTRKTWALRSFRALGTDHTSLWPTRDLLSEMGQASLETMQGYYLHDPLVFLVRLPRGGELASEHAGWILDMLPRTARRLLGQDHSWLRPRTSWVPPAGMDHCELPATTACGRYEPSVAAASGLLNLLAAGQSIDAAIGVLAWPNTLRDKIERVLATLRDHGVALGAVETDGFYALAPPSRAHGHEALEHCAMDAHCWDALAWIFEQWLADWRMRGAKGFTARTRDWEQRVPRNSPVRRLPWKAEAQGHMTFHGLASGRTHEHSAWSAVRWLSLSAWVLRQLRT